jgi:hypothetical protein
MNSKHQKTLDAIFDSPTRSDIRWGEIESLFRALGADIMEGRGSRVHVALKGRWATFHRPHPHPVTNKGAVTAVRRFLKSVEIKPC